MAEPVVVTSVGSETEAEIACGLLRANGIKCGASLGEPAGGISAALGTPMLDGPVEILVDEKDLDAARKLLAEAEAK